LPIQGLYHEFDQPYIYKEWVFAFVGEIFNYKELLPWAKSDIETVAFYFDQMGPDCMELFDGFWSIVAYHKRSKQLYVCTDVLAKKPVYYYPDNFCFASEMKALLKVVEPDPDLLYYSSVAKWGYTPSNRTPFLNIKKMDPATVIQIDVNSGKEYTYQWTVLRPQSLDIRKALELSVKNRLVSDVPISLLLSGGLDSSIIYKLIEQHTHDFTIFHVDNDESEYLNHLNIPSAIKVQRVRYEQVSLEKILYYNECPVDLGSMIPQYLLSQAIAERCPDIPVVITGDGADELFGGYRRQFEYDAQYSDIFEELVYYHLPRLDKMSMAFTLELRSPFLARNVIEGAMYMPYEDRINKNGLKRLFEDLIPPAILDRPKVALKSDPVRNRPSWRHDLIEHFKEETVYEYQ